MLEEGEIVKRHLHKIPGFNTMFWKMLLLQGNYGTGLWQDQLTLKPEKPKKRLKKVLVAINGRGQPDREELN